MKPLPVDTHVHVIFDNCIPTVLQGARPPHKENTPERAHARVGEDSRLRVHVCRRHYTRGRKRRPIPIDVALIVNSSHNPHCYVDLTVRSDG